MKRRNRFNFAKEAIAFQRDDFGQRIEKIMTDIQVYIKDTPPDKRDSLYQSDLIRDLEKLIFNRLGAKIIISKWEDHEDPINAGTQGAFGWSPHIFTHDGVYFPVLKETVPPEYHHYLKYAEDYYQQDAQLAGKRGYVDLGKAKLSGAFSERLLTMQVEFEGLYEKLGYTPDEITATILHELGHVFQSFEYSDRMTRTNEVLADLAKTVRGEKDLKRQTYLIKELGEALDLDSKTRDEIIDSPNRIVLGYRLFKALKWSFESQLPVGKYNITTPEQLADNFAARFGYGRQLITSLEKFEKYDRENTILKFTIMREMCSQVITMKHLLLLVVAIAAFPGFMFFLMVAIFIWAGVAAGGIFVGIKTYEAGADNQDMTYDEIRVRYKRIRHQYIEMIKQLNLPKDQLQKVINDINAMDTIIRMTESHKGLFDRFKNFFISRHRDTANEIELQQLIEDLVHNDLFLKSRELELLAQSST